MPSDPDIHSIARAFQQAADSYEHGRAEYPAAAARALLAALKIQSASCVLEVGAGTGKFTRLLKELHTNVIITEPMTAMLAKLSVAVPATRAVVATAQSLPFPARSVDAVIAAQCFHWFATPTALAELHRVLRPGAGFGLIWNIMDKRVDWVRQLYTCFEHHKGDIPQYREGHWKQAFTSTCGFAPLQQQSFDYQDRMTPARLVDRIVSISFIAALPSCERAQVAAAVRHLAATHPELRGKAEFELPYQTDIYWTARQ